MKTRFLVTSKETNASFVSHMVTWSEFVFVFFFFFFKWLWREHLSKIHYYSVYSFNFPTHCYFFILFLKIFAFSSTFSSFLFVKRINFQFSSLKSGSWIKKKKPLGNPNNRIQTEKSFTFFLKKCIFKNVI